MTEVDRVDGALYRPDTTLKVLHSKELRLCSVHVREATHPTAGSQVWSANRSVVDLALTPRPDASWGRYVDGPKVRGALGRVLFVPAGRTIETGTSAGRVLSMSCNFDPTLMEEVLSSEPSWSDSTLERSLDLRDVELRLALAKLYRELANGDFASALLIELAVRWLVIHLVRKFSLHDQFLQCRNGALPPWRLRRIRDRLYADEPLPDVSELAELCNLSPRHLSRTFKTETGRTLSKYIAEAMVERANDLLQNSRMSVEQIAAALGFASAPSFAAAYRRMTGLAPSQIFGRRRIFDPQASQRASPSPRKLH